MENIKEDIANIQNFSEEILRKSKIKSDPFWDRAEQNLLKALALYVMAKYPKEKRNLTSVYSLLNSQQIDEIFANLPNEHPAKIPYDIYAQANNMIKIGTLIGLKVRLEMLL
ncbi:hypothetical protein [Thermoanaerobacterium sp. RBIITD]|uniref:hypothetical protein n=1 Tax=Thermoanaerobacterium sp. RBIITD TaxID=1550240 RepID=UPI000BB9AA06|nr:hypothetical protein [Thermoanaerobacterium sp. RBIITD]